MSRSYQDTTRTYGFQFNGRVWLSNENMEGFSGELRRKNGLSNEENRS